MTGKRNNPGPPKEFLAEAEDNLNLLGKGLMALEKSYKAGIITPSLVNGIFRTAHTLKGVCGIYEYDEMVRLSHAMEDSLDSIRIGRILLTDELLDGLIHSYALLVKMTPACNTTECIAEVDTIIESLIKCEVARLGSHKKDQIDSKILEALTRYQENMLFEAIRSGMKILLVECEFHLATFDADYEALVKLLEPDCEIIATLPSKEKSSAEIIGLNLLVGTNIETTQVEERSGSKCRVIYAANHIPEYTYESDLKHTKTGGEVAEPKKNATLEDTLKSSSNSVRVDISKLDRVMSIVGELGLLRADLTRLAGELKKELPYSTCGFELSRLEQHLDRRFSELRDSVLDVRMVQIGQLFARYETLLSRLCRKTGKEVRMETFGADTELDKLMVEELADPIMHMIRNVVDHAIEAPDERPALGKERCGTITFSAYQKGNRVVVEVTDDGRGIDEELIAKKAVKKGLISKEYVNNLSRLEKLDLIFLPGFTTMDVVSDVSGRGVGLDVVKENIARLSGAIEIETIMGKGTKFILTIPITLAVTQALIVEDAGERYALPLSSVNEVITIDPGDIFFQDGKEILKIDGRTVPVARLAAVMGRKYVKSSDKPLNGVLAGIAEHRLCITAEKIVEQLDVVIKPISSLIKVPGIAGATDLGMGEKGTILVLDIRDILETLISEKSGPLTDDDKKKDLARGA